MKKRRFEMVFDNDGEELYLLIWRDKCIELVVMASELDDLWDVLSYKKRRSDKKDKGVK